VRDQVLYLYKNSQNYIFFPILARHELLRIFISYKISRKFLIGNFNKFLHFLKFNFKYSYTVGI
jgi:hypothetical protein